MQRVGIRFCGGCCQVIERSEVFRKIEELTKGTSSFVGVEEKDLDAFLFICGCLDACPVDELGFRGHPKAIVVAGDTLDDEVVPERDLPREVVKKLQTM